MKSKAPKFLSPGGGFTAEDVLAAISSSLGLEDIQDASSGLPLVYPAPDNVENYGQGDRLAAIQTATKTNPGDYYGSGDTVIGFSSGIPVKGNFKRTPFESESQFLARTRMLQEAAYKLADKERRRYGGGR